MPLAVYFKPFDVETFEIDFDRDLHTRGTDWQLFKNDWVKGDGIFQLLNPETDTILLREILIALMRDDTGVSSVRIKNCRLCVSHSRAIDLAGLEARILEVIHRVESDVEVLNPNLKTYRDVPFHTPTPRWKFWKKPLI